MKPYQASLLAVFLQLSSLFAQESIPPDREGLLQGAGMGMALPAEKQGFPGPKHVLELGEQLGLTNDQRMKAQALMESVKASAVIKGEDIVKAEQDLVRLFANSVSEKQLEQKIREIAVLRGELRFVHLQAHLRMAQILTAGQVERYSALRNHGTKQQD